MVETVDEYVASFPEEVRTVLETVRAAIRRVAPELGEKISYGMVAFTMDGHSVIYLGGWKHHLAIYPVPGGDEEFQSRLAPYRSAKGTLRFPLRQPIPYDLIEDVVRRLTDR